MPGNGGRHLSEMWSDFRMPHAASLEGGILSLIGRPATTLVRTALAASAAAAVALLTVIGTASASTEGFLREMDTPFATSAEQLSDGKSICAALSRGREQELSGPAAAAIITKVSDYNARQGRAGSYAVRLISAAVKELCPINRDFVMVAARAYDSQIGE